MKHLVILILICGFIYPSTFEVFTQDTQSTTTNNTKYVRLILQNGGMYEGEVLEIDESSFLINTLQLGNMRITKTDILSITYISADEVGQMKMSNRTGDINPQASRYFFAPSAIQLKKGEGYYQNGILIYNQISYGLTDNITAGATMTIFGMGGSVKIGTQISDDFAVSVGGIGIKPFADFLDPTGIVFANMTFGDERKNMSIGYGAGFSGSTNTNMLNISGMLEMNYRLWLMTENYFLEDISILSFGIRRASNRRDVLWDYTLVYLNIDGNTAPLPWISCTIPF